MFICVHLWLKPEFSYARTNWVRNTQTEDEEARIEIIPLIDIMFFLLAAFMLVSLSMVNLKSVKVNLPTATTATPETKKDFLDISVDKSGGVYLDKNPIGSNELVAALTAAAKSNPNLRIFISADKDARHGDVIAESPCGSCVQWH